MVGLALQYADTLTLTVLRLATILALLLPLGLLTEGPPPGESLRPLLIASAITGLLGWGAGMYLFVLSIGLIGVAATSAATALTPVLSQLTTKLVAGERVRASTVLGALLTAVGIVVTAI
jgi:drug/metabolite transporter (DMT)-like permease